MNSTVTGWTNYGNCYILRYLYYTTNYAAYIASGTAFTSSYLSMTGIVCHCDLLGTITGATLTLSTGYLPSKWATAAPGYSSVSSQSGALQHLAANSATLTGTLTATSITFPAFGPSMVNSVGSFGITLPIGLERSVLIVMKTGSPSINLPFAFTGTCATYYNGVKIPVGCNFVSTPIQIDYTLTIL